MNDLLKADLFFLITAFGVIVVTIVLSTALYYVVRILRDVRHISKVAKEETDHIAEDVEHLRSALVGPKSKRKR